MLLQYIDIIGTFAFALSGTSAGIRRGFDIFGILVLAMSTAVGGGIVRDLCINATPPAGLIHPVYLITVIVAVFVGVFFQRLIIRMEKPTLWLDALGLGFFSAFGAHKTYEYTGEILLSLILGCVSAVGGGVIRDILAHRPPLVLTRDIYASAALIGAGIELMGVTGVIDSRWSTWLAIGTCTLIRVLSLRYHIHLPSITSKFDK